MRILILNWRDLEHPRAGGSEVYAHHLARSWTGAGHEVTFFASVVPGQPPDTKRDGYRLIRRGGQFTVYREARRFYRTEGRGSFDAVLDIVNTRPFLASQWAVNTQVVTLIHQVAKDVWRYEVPWPAYLFGRYYLEPKWLKRLSDTPIITISESSKTSLAEYGLSDVSVVHVGTESVLPQPLPPKAQRPTVLFVGRLASNKRPGDAVKAFQLLREELPDAQLWVIGDGPLRASLSRDAGPSVTFFGHVDAATKQDLMASAHALVSTSVREGWGMTVSEAAHLGTRSVTYDVPGLRDSVPVAGGRLVRPDPQALAAELAAALPFWTAEARPDLGEAGVLRWEEVAQEVLAYLEQRTRGRRSEAV